MTTYIIFPDAGDGFLSSHNMTFATAQAGSNIIVDTTSDYLKTGMNIAGNGEYYIHQSFLSFDTSVIVDTEEIVDSTITAYLGYPQGQSGPWGQQLRQFNYTTPLTSAQWQTPTLARTRPQFANFDHLFSATPYQWRATGKDTLVAGISKTAATKFVMVSNTYTDGFAPTGVQEVWANGSRNATNKPYMTVYTVPLSTLNNVSEASTTLPDGTTVSIRSNGTATPTLTLGYNTLTSSTWTSIGAINAGFTTNLDGDATISLANDPAGNLFVVGLAAGTTGTIAAQAYTKTGATTWSAGPVLTQALPRGNDQTVRSISTVYMTGGSDKTDIPSIYSIVARGSGGNRPEFPYHVSGAGYPHGVQISPVALLNGTGTLFYGVGTSFSPSPACAVPAFVDSVAFSPNLRAVYVARGKVGTAIVGGISVIKSYGPTGSVFSQNNDYTPTGSSQLVAVSPTVFAHVFDENSLKLTVRFYNAACQIIGETSIAKDAFYGATIGNKFTAYFDKTANLVRVFYVDASSARNLSRFDVSPVTYTGTVTVNVITGLGATGSLITGLRVSRTTDERRVLLEAAINTSGAVSTSGAYTTIGNVVPSAPALTTRPNFDATSAATFTWAFGDVNPLDKQTAYQLEISRVSDSVVVYDSGKVVSAVSSATVAANVLANAVNYRWRVRTYDTIDAVGTWSGYGTFTTAATGTLTITDPATDNLAGVETSAYTVSWLYVQSGGATQAQRRVRVIRTSDSAVISDTTMQVNTTPYQSITGMESGKEYRIEVSLVNSGAISVPVVSRLITPYYSEPMTPTLVVSPKDSYVEIAITNPTPTGDRPEVIYNDIYKRRTKVDSTAADFKRIATLNTSATYKDYAVKSGVSYDYYVVGRTF